MRRIAPFVILLGLSGCAAFQPPALTNMRFRSLATNTTNDEIGEPGGAVTIAVSTTDPASKDSSIAITALAERAQAALITQTKGKPPVSLKDSSPSSDNRVRVDGTIQRQAVIAVRPTQVLPYGDRIDAVSISIQVDPRDHNEWRISNWSEASNSQTVLEVGSVSLSSTSKLTGSTGLKISPALPSATVGGEADKSDTQTADIKDVQSFYALVGNDGIAWIDEVAGWRTDLAGNLTMTITLTEDPQQLETTHHYTASKLKTDDKSVLGYKLLKPLDVELSQITERVPKDGGKPICGLAHLNYRIRHIVNKSGQSTFSEADDIIRPHEGTADERFVFAPAPFQQRYVINLDQRDLGFQANGQKANRLIFSSLIEADEFADWLQRSFASDSKSSTHGIGLLKIGNGVIGAYERIAGSRSQGGTILPITEHSLSGISAVVDDLDTVRDVQSADAVGCPEKPLAPVFSKTTS